MTETKPDTKKIKAFLDALCKRHPKTFNLRKRIALKIKIKEDILAMYKSMTPELLDAALKYYTHHPSYHLAICLQSHRRDLKGDKVQEIKQCEKKSSLKSLKYFKEKGFHKGRLPILKDEKH